RAVDLGNDDLRDCTTGHCQQESQNNQVHNLFPRFSVVLIVFAAFIYYIITFSIIHVKYIRIFCRFFRIKKAPCEGAFQDETVNKKI
ncbi:hypothetical protein JW992_10765, partial [candidate division KSB1 bacterium]|nr:hypothetical protein [candidate division KSB1 bacterium]